ncbi:MAG: DUF1499 domain-containing protein [Tateyamaria sp.]|uniref:DUF1499 domain-containing protein n=1 Tax=Tateyamaria sp. TaxID=1929288 RepID=UPI0032A04556
MKVAMYIAGFIVLFVALLVVYIRFAPSDAARWHQPVEATADANFAVGASRVLAADIARFEKTDNVIRALPRTQLLAGSLEDGLVTYVTRSQLWGFPDYTTVQFENGTLKLFGRSRFGRSDLGVNAARLTQVVATIK